MSFNAGAITGSIGLDTGPLNRAIGQSKQSLFGLQSATGGVFSGMASLISPATLAIAGIGLALGGVAAIGAGIGFGAKLAADAEQAEIAFGTLLGSTDKAESLLADLNHFAASTPFEMPGLTAATRQLIAFGSSQGQVMPELRALGDIAAGTGSDLQELALIYGQARKNGVLMGDDIKQLGTRGIPIIGELAKQFGVAESEVKDLVSGGKVGFGNLQQAIKDLTAEGSMFGGGMAAQSKSINGLTSTLRDNLGMMAKELADDLFERVNAKGFIADLTAAIPVLKAVIGGVVDLSSRALGGLAQMFGLSGDAAGDSGNKIIAAMEWGAKGIAFVADSIDAAIYGYDMLRLGVTKYYKFAAEGIAGLLRFTSKLPDWLGGGMAADVAGIAEMFAANLDAEIVALQRGINDKLIAPSNGEKVMAFFRGITAEAEAAANATAAVVPELEVTAAIAGNPEADKLIADLQAQLDGIGLSKLDQEFADLRAKGILDPDQLTEARKILEAIDLKSGATAALESIKTPFETYQEELDRLNQFLSAGLIDQGQFDQLDGKARKDAFGEEKFAALNMVGSAEELSLRQKMTAAAAGGGPSGGTKDYAKQQVDQLKQVVEKMVEQTNVIRQWLGSDQMFSIPGI